MKTTQKILIGLSALGLALTAGTDARANGFEELANGTEQLSRGGAWLARATDPLATFYNPAALSRNGTAVSLSVNLFMQNTCFERMGPGGQPVLLGGSNQYAVETCSEKELFPNPQLAYQWRVNDKLGVGVAVLGLSAVGKKKFADYDVSFRRPDGSFGEGPTGSRYILTEMDAKILWPQVAVGYEVAPKLRVGASLIWGLAFIKFANVSMGTSGSQGALGQRINEPGDQDARAKVTSKDLFVPGFVLSSMYTVGDNLDVALYYHWSDKVKAKGEATIESFVYNKNLKPSANPASVDTPKGQTDVTVPQPMEARVGARWYKKRPLEPGAAAPTRMDPLTQEVFDVELDLEWAHDSQFDTLGLRFAPQNIMANGDVPATIPQNADVAHNWKDSYGARLGGDYNLLPGKLALRGGLYFQTGAMRPEFAHVDFVPTQRLGLTLGGTFRAGPVDIQVGGGYVFHKTLDNGGNGGTRGIMASENPDCPYGKNDQPFHSCWGVNGGKVKTSTAVVSLGAVYRFGQ